MYGPEALLRNIECNSVMCFGAEEVGVSRLLRLVRGLGKEAALLRVAQFTQSTIPFIFLRDVGLARVWNPVCGGSVLGIVRGPDGWILGCFRFCLG